jgi:hypothetical protein
MTPEQLRRQREHMGVQSPGLPPSLGMPGLEQPPPVQYQAPGQPPPPDRDMLAQLLMQAAMRGSNPMGGPRLYGNDIPSMPPQPEAPQGWLPPSSNFNAPVEPTGPVWRPPPPASYGYAPLFHRLNPPTGGWRDIQT